MVISAFFIAGLSYSEYRRSGFRFSLIITWGFLIFGVWHIANIYFALQPALWPPQYIFGNGLLTITAISILYAQLLVAQVRGAFYYAAFFIAAYLIASLVVVILGEMTTTTVAVVGAHIGIAFALAGIIAISFQQGPLRYFMTVSHLACAVLFIYGILYVLPRDRYTGALLYFVFACAVPLTGLLFFQASINLAKQQMEESERNFRELFNSVRDVFFRVTTAGVIKDISPSIENFGYVRDSLIGRRFDSLVKNTEEFKKSFTRVNEKTPISDLGVSIRTGENDLIECEISMSLVRDSNAEEPIIVGNIRDVNEKNQLERQFLDSQRRESMGVLAGGIAHDFNNILQSIVGHAEWLMRAPDMTPEERNQHLKVVLEASTTAGMLCNQLLEYTGKSHARLAPIYVHTAINDVLELLASSVPDNIRIDSRMIDTSLVVDADPAQLRQVVLNLAKNAIDAMGNGGVLQVAVHQEHLTEDDLKDIRPRDRKLVDGDYVVIAMTDGGDGIDPKIVDRIFEPFYTTKEKGHGLGLAAVIGILSGHRGGIIVDSTQNLGTNMRVVLPMSAHPEIATTPDESDVVEGSGQTILIAEDDPELRLILRTTLERGGYRVVSANDGVEAVETFTHRQEEIAALILDVKMPNMNGIAAAREIRKLAPEIPILIASGYAEVPADDIDEDLAYLFLSKPYRHSQLFKTLANCLA